MADTTNNGNGYSVKEMLSLVVIPALEELKAHQTKRDEIYDKRIGRLEAWKNRGVGAFILLTVIIIPIAIPIIVGLLSGTGHTP